MKRKTAKLIADFLGICVGITYSLVMLFITFMLIRFTTIMVSEPNIFISTIEFVMAILATIYFCNRAIRFLSRKSVDDYHKKR